MAADLIAQRTLVVSAVNFTEGGPLTVLRECLSAAVKVLPPEWQIIALIHDKALLNLPRVRTVEIPDAKGSWWRRLRWEWFGFRELSLQWEPDLWLSLHDITPRVHARHQAVYCHNPAPFYQVRPREMLQEPKLLLFSMFYVGLYRLNIRRNRHVIVQQEWLRQEFLRRFGRLPMVVAHPSQHQSPTHGVVRQGARRVFLYPALARVFKNFEVIGEAAQLLELRGILNFEVRLTIDGSENRYARWLKSRFAGTPAVRFIGRQDSQHMLGLYAEASAVIFPSKLETWGLPISEAKSHGLPLLVADAPYARETVGTYDTVSFFPPDLAEVLADQMQAMIDGTWTPQGNVGVQPLEPFAPDWPRLLQLITDGLDPSHAADLSRPRHP